MKLDSTGSLFLAILALVRPFAAGQNSCVQVLNTSFSGCPCSDSTFSFNLSGQTSVESNTVNIALILDGSGSIDTNEWALETDFAEDVVAAFADRNLFENGGTATYVQFASAVGPSGTFNSTEAFNDFIDAAGKLGGGTNIESGIARGRELLSDAPASSLSFMIVITDGNGGRPEDEADAARAEGTRVFAVGVGNGVDDTTLLGIGGTADFVFSVDDFDLLNEALEQILASSNSSTVPCPSTGVSVAVEFSASVASTTFPSATVSGNTVTFFVDDLEANPTEFETKLDACNTSSGTAVVQSVTYSDDQGNSPDVSTLFDDIVPECPSTPVPTPAGTAPPSLQPTTTMPSAATATPSPTHITSSIAPPTLPPTTTMPSPINACAACTQLSAAQQAALASYDNGGKRIICDPTCLDGSTDPIHCNYFGLGQICRGCGDCSTCLPCP